MAFNAFSLNYNEVEVGGRRIYQTPTGKVFTCYRVDLIDEESFQVFEQFNVLNRLISKVIPGNCLRVYLGSEFNSAVNIETSRKGSLGKVGSIEFRAYIVIENPGAFSLDFSKWLKYLKYKSKRDFEDLLGQINELTSCFDKLNAKEITFDEFKAQVFGNCFEKLFLIDRQCLDFTGEYWGALRLNRFRQSEIPLNLLSHLKDQIDGPFTVSLSVVPYARQSSEFLLRTQIGKKSASANATDFKKLEDAESDLNEVVTQGERVCLFEFIVLLRRTKKGELLTTLSEAEDILSPLGFIEKEIFGVSSTVKAMIPGGGVQNQLYEKESNIPFFMPLVSRGNSKPKMNSHSLVAHRRDDSLDAFNLFNDQYDNFSACIFGKSGRGKSVLTNMLTRALHNDSGVRIIKVDVGGSHSRETRQLGGSEMKFSLDAPSGLNPFREAVGVTNKEATVSLLSNFLSVLMLEQNEIELSKEMRSDLEKSLFQYFSENPKQPNISDFIANSENLPRRGLLIRWGKDGVFRNAFKEADTNEADNRLRYYNFSEIFQASDPDFGQGGLAAIMAIFNFEMMKNKDKKIVFIADETPFFIKRCFSFFKFSTANVRKFGGSFITIAQNSSDVVVGGDEGILDNSNSKFLFSIDGNKEEFQKRLKVSSKAIETIESLEKINGKLSEVLLSDGISEMVLRLRVSPQEYWSITSSHKDTTKLNHLLKAVPGLTEGEAIECLARF
jgi:energy-coupling factor transporter ATP-binding protein EcfA2